MSLSRIFEHPPAEMHKADICPEPEELKVEITIDGEPVKVNMKQKVKEYLKNGKAYGYLLHVDLPSKVAKKQFHTFKIVMTDLKNGDKGETVVFKEIEAYM